MSTPEVRVRLTPEGINEVIHALRQLQAESGKATQAAAKGTSLLGTAVRDLKSLLPALGLAAVVGGMAALTKQALATADATGKLQQRVGGTVEEISGLTLAFRTNDSDQAALQQTLAKTANVMQDVANDSGDARRALEDIGVDAEALTKLTTPRALEEIAKKLAALPAGAQRAAAATKIFGRNAQELIPALDAVGREGIDKFIDKARALGVLIDDDLADAAARARDSLALIRIQAEGVATQFAAGLAPEISAAMAQFSQAVTGDGLNGIRLFGQVVGKIIRGIVALFVGLGKSFGALAAQIGSGVRSLAAAAKLAFTGDFAGAARALEEGIRERAQIRQQLGEDLIALGKSVFEEAPAGAARSAGGGVTPDPEALRQQSNARLAALRSAQEAELALQREGLKIQEEANKQAFEQGLISLQDFFARRRQLIEAERDLEIRGLQAQRAALAAGATGAGAPASEVERIKLRQQLADLDAKIAQAQVQAARELLALDGELTQAQKDLGREREQSQISLLELEGRRHEAFMRNLALEIQQIRELGARAGASAAEIEADIARFTAARTSQFNFEEAIRRGQEALSSFDRDAAAIQRNQEAGIISQLEGELQLIDLQRRRLATLQQLAAAALTAAQASGDPEAIARAEAFNASVQQVALSFQAATDAGHQFRTGAIEAFQTGIQTLLANAEEIESLGDAFKSLARTVVQSLNQIAAEIIAKQATFALLRLFGSSLGAGSAPAAGAKRGGFLRGYAGGGDIRAPEVRSIPGPDKIPLLGQKGEFILRRSRVREPGALDFLRQWNSGRFTLAQAMRVPRFATGGEVGASAAARAALGGGGGNVDRIRIVNVIGQEAVTDAMASAAGERTMLNFIQRNSTAIRRVLGS